MEVVWVTTWCMIIMYACDSDVPESLSCRVCSDKVLATIWDA